MRAKATKGVEVQPSCVCRDEAGAKRAACARAFSMGCPVHSAMMRFRLALWYMISLAWISMSTACAATPHCRPHARSFPKLFHAALMLGTK